MNYQTILTGEKRKRYHQFLVCRIFQTVAKIRIYNFNIILSMLTLHRHYGSASGPFFFILFFFFFLVDFMKYFDRHCRIAVNNITTEYV